MSNASMALLKGMPKKGKAADPVKAAAVAEELEPGTVAETAAVATEQLEPAQVLGVDPAEAEEVKVDVDALDEAGIAALVKEHEIGTPDFWASLSLDGKKEWLNKEFGEEPAAPAAEAATEEDVPFQPTEEAAAQVVSDTSGKDTVVGKGDQGAEVTPGPATKPKASKSKAVAKDSSKTGEVLPPDLISAVAGELENLKETEARKLVTELREGSDFGFFKLGGVLSVIQSNNWIEPHGSFKDFVEAEHGLNYRRAMYWIGIYNGLVNSGIPWEAVKSLGWTKLKEIVPVLTKDNVKQWVKTAEKQTTLQLIETVKSDIANQQQKQIGSEAQPSSGPVTTKTFKVHPDQKKTIDEALTRAKASGNTAFDTVALEYICLDYLGGPAKSTADVPGQLQKIGLDEALKAFEAAFPNVSLTAEVDAADAA